MYLKIEMILAKRNYSKGGCFYDLVVSGYPNGGGGFSPIVAFSWKDLEVGKIYDFSPRDKNTLYGVLEVTESEDVVQPTSERS